MTIQDLQGKRVKLSRSTITLKDENGKTFGMVRGLERFSDMTGRRQFDAFQIVKKSGLWGNKCGLSIDRLYFDGKQAYYIFSCGYVPPYEIDRYNAKMELLEQLQANGIEIIRVAST